MKKVLVLLAILALGAVQALAADPECVDPTVYDETTHGQYDATQHIVFCTPEADDGGTPLADGDLTSCTITAAGQPVVLTSTNRPGAYVDFTTPDAVKQAARFGEISVFCSTSAGDGAPAVASNARFRDATAPGQPTLLRP